MGVRGVGSRRLRRRRSRRAAHSGRQLPRAVGGGGGGDLEGCLHPHLARRDWRAGVVPAPPMPAVQHRLRAHGTHTGVGVGVGVGVRVLCCRCVSSLGDCIRRVAIFFRCRLLSFSLSPFSFSFRLCSDRSVYLRSFCFQCDPISQACFALLIPFSVCSRCLPLFASGAQTQRGLLLVSACVLLLLASTVVLAVLYSASTSTSGTGAVPMRACASCTHAHNTTQHNTTQHNTTQHNTTQHNTTQHNTTQHNTTQHNTAQHNIIQHNTTQHNTTQHNTMRVTLW